MTPLQPTGRPNKKQTLLVVSWLESFFKTRVEHLPNKKILQLPDSFSKLEVWNIYKEEFSSHVQLQPITYKYFYKIWNRLFSNVKIPKVNKFNSCVD